MAVELTESAARHVNQMLAKRGQGIGLRLGTKKAGCSGFAYVVDYADAIGENDEVFESHGVKVVVDRDSLPLVDGTVIDFVSSCWGTGISVTPISPSLARSSRPCPRSSRPRRTASRAA